MLTILLSLNLSMTLTFIMLNHPLSMGMILLIQTILISLITGNLNQNLWFSYILFLILIGGMLILFMYMTSIASNEKFKPNMKFMVTMMTIPISAWMMYSVTKNKLNNNQMMEFSQNMQMNLSLNKYINFPLNIILIFMIIYLLLTLIATVKITDFKQGPLRQMN